MKRFYCLLFLAGLSGLFNDISAMEQHKAAAHECMACYTGQEEKVTALLAQNVDVNALDESGNAPLYFAASQGSKAIVQLLIGRECW